MLHLPAADLLRLEEHACLLDHEKAGQRLLALRATSALLARHSLTWGDVIAAAFASVAVAKPARLDMAHPTTSLRAPREHHALIRAVAAALTRNASLADPLRQIVEGRASDEVLPVVSRDISTIETRLLALERCVGHLLRGVTRGTYPPPGRALRNAMQPALQATRVGSDPEWAIGTGSSRRLTPAGRTECDARLAAGESIAMVARHMGISIPSARYRRGRLAAVLPEDARRAEGVQP
jgi:hypothetical protein